MTFFWTLWAFDALTAAVVLYFFFIGLADGSVSASNLGLWLLMLGTVAVILLGSLWLNQQGMAKPAKALLLLLAAPGLVALIFMLAVLFSNQRWN